MFQIKHQSDKSTPKFQQVIDAMIIAIDSGSLAHGSKLPSIDRICVTSSFSRVTVERAYITLKKRGYISAETGRGYYVAKKVNEKIKVLLIFNRLSHFKNQTYYGLIETLHNHATVDLKLHHYDLNTLNEIIDRHLGNYDYYVVMPHFFYKTDQADIVNSIKRIPQDKLFVLDKRLEGLRFQHRSVHQDFKKDMCEALTSVLQLISTYQAITIIESKEAHYPVETAMAIRQFAMNNHIKCNTIDDSRNIELATGTIYIAAEDDDLVNLLKIAKKDGFKPGKEIGIIGLNETPLKDLLDITVFTTDFAQLGRTAGKMLLSGEVKVYTNPFKVILRKSL